MLLGGIDVSQDRLDVLLLPQAIIRALLTASLSVSARSAAENSQP
jgi:hypothetical protein